MAGKTNMLAAALGVSAFMILVPIEASAASLLLKEGMRGDSVVELQKDLKALGYLDAAATGYYGQLTVDAVKSFQRKNGLSADGIAGQETLALVGRLTGDNGGSSGASGVLKQNMRGDSVASLQRNLIALGYLDANATGFYGPLTVAAVKSLQEQNGLSADGIAGPGTFSLIQRLLGDNRTANTFAANTASSRGSGESSTYLVPWFDGASDIFSIGTVATVYDIDSGKSFKMKRTYGTNHADCEPLTKKDADIIKEIYGGSWSWTRRAIIVDVGGRKMAASLAAMPHAGSESAAANATVNSRSGGYGRGANLDAVKGNGVSGVMDVHFLGSKTHGTNRVDPNHQRMVKKAAAWAAENYK